MGNMKGTARPTKVYLAKKKNPIRWWIGQLLKKIGKWFQGNQDLYIRKGI
jgi:hypothetical protein